MIHDPQTLAICLTAIGVKAGREYTLYGIELYMLQGVDGTDYVIKYDDKQQTFTDALQAATFFAEKIWKIK